MTGIYSIQKIDILHLNYESWLPQKSEANKVMLRNQIGPSLLFKGDASFRIESISLTNASMRMRTIFTRFVVSLLSSSEIGPTQWLVSGLKSSHSHNLIIARYDVNSTITQVTTLSLLEYQALDWPINTDMHTASMDFDLQIALREVEILQRLRPVRVSAYQAPIYPESSCENMRLLFDVVDDATVQIRGPICDDFDIMINESVFNLLPSSYRDKPHFNCRNHIF